MCQLSYISTLGQINDKELRFKAQQRQSVQQIRKTYFTYCIMGFILGNARLVIPYETRIQTEQRDNRFTDVKIKVCGSLLTTNSCNSRNRYALAV